MLAEQVATRIRLACGSVALVIVAACSRAAPPAPAPTPEAPLPASSGVVASIASVAPAAGGKKGACTKTAYVDEAGEPSGPAPACKDGEVLVVGKAFTTAAAGEGALLAPSHRVVVKSFCLDSTEVSIGALNRCGPCVAAMGPIPGNASRPARGLDPATMDRFCAEQGKRLPTEPEYELASQGLAPSTCSGSTPCDVGATAGDRAVSGAMDLAGNVAELTATEVCACEPTGTCRLGRVVRGASYAAPLKGTRARALRLASDGTQEALGFRCARSR